MTRNKIIPYNPKLKTLARELRKNSTLSEVILWNKIKGRALGYQFHRQVPIGEFIVDFYCHELLLAIEIDGSSHDYNFENDDQRQKKLELFGIEIVRFLDIDIKQGLNDVLRILEITVAERSCKKVTTPPCPPQGGNLPSKIPH
jgi:very-short-patch-repair endonuclease